MWTGFLDTLWEAALFMSSFLLVGVFVGSVSALLAPRWAGPATGAVLLAQGALGAVLLLQEEPRTWLLVAVPILAALLAGVTFGGALKRGSAWLIGAGAFFCLLAWLLPMLLRPEALSNRPRVLLVGLDGATWTILDELGAEGAVPNLSRLKDEGTSGILRSDHPMLSPRVWTTIATGKSSEHHGVRDFFATQNEDLAAVRLWEILAHHGYSVGVFRWLLTWPPDSLAHFVVPGWMARDAQTYPLDLAFIKELELVFQNQSQGSVRWTQYKNWALGYLAQGLRLRTCLKIGVRFINDVAFQDGWERDYAAKRQIFDYLNNDVFLNLLRRRRPDFASIVLYGSDNLAHKFWRYRYPEDFGISSEEAAPFRNLLSDYYEEADDFIGELLDLVDEKTLVFVVSDHGYSSFGEKRLGGHRLYTPRMERLAKFLGVEVPEQASLASVARQGYFSFHGSEEEKMALSERVAQSLERIRDAREKKPIFEVKKVSSDTLEVVVNLSLQLDADDLLETPDGELKFDRFVQVEDRKGTHSLEGILIARGPRIRRGNWIEGARLADVTPTILHFLGLPVGQDMDGEVLWRLASDDTEARVRTIPSYEEEIQIVRELPAEVEQEALTKELRALGYLN